ncbi:MAG: tetratricopeptide repeat protein [Gemmataceae bacterium]
MPTVGNFHDAVVFPKPSRESLSRRSGNSGICLTRDHPQSPIPRRVTDPSDGKPTLSDDSMSPSVLTRLGTPGRNRTVLQGYTPLASSLEWELGARYLAKRGSQAFLSDPVPVPYAVNNSGFLSRQASELLFTSLEASRPSGRIVALELGIGLGLFARYFLDSFRELCRSRGSDYYDRLLYIAADRSERMLLDAVRHGTFANHSGRYCLRVIDAMDPASAIRADPLFSDLRSPISAVFLNYLLDCLPAAVLRTDPLPASSGSLKQLCVQTCLARGVELREYTDLTTDDLLRLASSPRPSDREDLLELFGLFTSEYEYQPVDAAELPYGEFAQGWLSRQSPGTVVHSHGAIRSLEELLDLLDPSGFILMNDYGSSSGSEQEFEHQRYTGSTFVGVNFSLLEAYFTTKLGSSECKRWVAPVEDSGRIYSRLLGHDLQTAVVEQFANRFSKPVWDRLDQPVQAAKTVSSQGRVELALSQYRAALVEQPWNWLLLGEIANFLNFALQDPQTALEVARAGLELNPGCSADLWNAYGDAAFALGRFAPAKLAFERAIAINPEDVQSRFNLSWVYLQRREHLAALTMIAEGLARDRTGAFRDRLLQKQSGILGDLARRTGQEHRTLLNRINYAPRSLGPESVAPPLNVERGK